MASPPPTGRFAPSPTGELHFGSLIAAVASYLQVKSIGGKWLIRVEDLDPPRTVAGSAAGIIKELQRLGMVSDEPVLYQSSRNSAYQVALEQLQHKGVTYGCACTRSDIPSSGIYPGICSTGIAAGKTARSIRFRVPSTTSCFKDLLQGEISETLGESCGDFIIHRADGLFAYQLAVVVDDAFQKITQIVRGADLLDSTNRQIALQQALELSTPTYMHLPVAIDKAGNKLSKSSHADPLTHTDPAHAIRQSLLFLGHKPPTGLALKPLWQWAKANWKDELIPRKKAILPPGV